MKFVKKYIGLIIAGLAIIIIVAAALVLGADETKTKSAAGKCGNYRNDQTVLIKGQRFKAEIPNNPDAYAKGLGGRPCIMSDQAMLFVFSKPGQYRFWMKGMKFPIDIIWISADYNVAAIEIDVEPSTYTSKYPFFSNDKNHLAQYVLELKANTAKDLHMDLGTAVTL